MGEPNEMTVAAVIPTYNAAKYIRTAIDSVLAQRRKCDEIIVVDDGSTDDTARLVKSYGPGVTYIHQQNAGASVARNTAIKAATSRWIAFLDADDKWLPEKLEMQLELLKNNKDLLWCYGNFFCCPHGSDKKSLTHQQKVVTQLLIDDDHFSDYLGAYTAGLWTWTGVMIVKKTVFDKVGFFIPAQTIGEDTDLWTRIALEYPQIGYVNQPLAIYLRDVPQSATTIQEPLESICSRISRLCDYADKHNRSEDFKPCVRKIIRRITLDLLAAGRYADVGKLITSFTKLLTFRFKTEMRLRAIFPKTAPSVIATYENLKKHIRNKS